MGYRGLQGATGAYKRLLGVIGRYNGLQLVPRGYIRLQGVSDGYNGQHYMKRRKSFSHDLFSRSMT